MEKHPETTPSSAKETSRRKVIAAGLAAAAVGIGLRFNSSKPDDTSRPDTDSITPETSPEPSPTVVSHEESPESYSLGSADRYYQIATEKPREDLVKEFQIPKKCRPDSRSIRRYVRQ